MQVESAKSGVVELSPFGVLQAGVLGSTIFAIYKNDIPAATPKHDVKDQQTVCYVDESNDLAAAKYPAELMNKLQARADMQHNG